MEGTVKTLKLDKGFFFIRVRGESDVFGHVSDLDPSLPFDEALLERRVDFHIVTTAKGPRATAIRAAD